MMEYHKIQSIYKRDERGRFIDGQWTSPVFEYLRNNSWVFTEKVDGTNIRIYWNHLTKTIRIGGRTDSAQIQISLLDRLNKMFTRELFETVYPEVSMTLYGEGYGAKIQKGGGNYSQNQDFVLFDIFICGFWLERENVEDISVKLGLRVVPILREGTLDDAISMCKTGFMSTWGNFTAEGIVLRPKVTMFSRNGERIITKVKCRDFK